MATIKNLLLAIKLLINEGSSFVYQFMRYANFVEVGGKEEKEILRRKG